MTLTSIGIFCTAAGFAWTCAAAAATMSTTSTTSPVDDRIPQFRRTGDATQLYVDGRPFLILGGELGNSTAASLELMQPIWPRLRGLNLNTVLAPVYWELLEPQEGRFEFTLVDGLLDGARQHDLRLVLLWFGAWKNSMSSYAPAWVKLDQRRFGRAMTKDGRGVEILSPFSKANLDADATAFAALMRHLRERDGDRHTVILIQVENEIGMLPDARDHSPAADAAFARPVPAELLKLASPSPRVLGEGKRGTWRDGFGETPEGEEVFTAWHFARYVNEVVRRGKAEYPLPMYVNAALNRPGRAPGEYPSGGPLPHLLDVWRAGAPLLDMLSPDIYFANFAEWTEKYHRPGNPVFVPEALRSIRASANALYVIGQHDAIGFSPFGIESISGESAELLGKTYSALRQLTPLIVERQGKVKLFGVSPKIGYDGSVDLSPQQVTAGRYTLTISFAAAPHAVAATAPATSNDPATRGADLPASAGMVIQTGEDEYTVVGTGLTITHAVANSRDEQCGLLKVDEWAERADGTWHRTRRLNGDQTHQGRHVQLPGGTIGMQQVRLYRYR